MFENQSLQFVSTSYVASFPDVVSDERLVPLLAAGKLLGLSILLVFFLTFYQLACAGNAGFCPSLTVLLNIICSQLSFALSRPLWSPSTQLDVFRSLLAGSEHLHRRLYHRQTVWSEQATLPLDRSSRCYKEEHFLMHDMELMASTGICTLYTYKH